MGEKEQICMNYDAQTGEIKGFYFKSIHGDNIPEPNREITMEKYQFYMAKNGVYKLNPSTLEDVLIPSQAKEPQLPTQEERLKALESALSSMMGV